MRRILLLTALLFALPAAAQQPLDPADYRYPVLDVQRLYSANFGEIRPGHFHAGVDIKTDGVEGKRLVAAMDGYVSRIVVQAGGYGRAVYLTLKNGTTAVYGHMQRFRDDLEQLVRDERYRRRSNSVDLWFTADRFPVRQGDFIGYSGNSGSSGGPHLHYEIRDTRDQRLRNLVREGIIRPADSLPPRFMKLHYIEIDSLDGLCIRRPAESYAVVRTGAGRYRLTRSEALPVGRRGYFVAEVTDRRNGVQNTFAIWRLQASVDGDPYFEFRIDHYTHPLSRTCDAVSCYPMQLGSRNEVIRLAQLERAPALFYPTMKHRGVIGCEAGERRTIDLVCEDDCGNRSQLSFEIVGRAEPFRAEAPADPALRAVHPSAAAAFEYGDFSARIPAGALYDGCYAKAEAGRLPKVDSGVVVLSPAYRLLDARTPLEQPIRIAIRTHVPKALQFKASVVARNYRGGAVRLGGKYEQGVVAVETRTVGDWFVAADTLAPRIRPAFAQGADLRSARKLRFRASDNFSGIASWRLEIDGEWVPCDRYPMRGTLVHHFDRAADGRLHRAVLQVRDGSGNSARWEGTFRR